MSILPKSFSRDDFLNYLVSETILDNASAARVRTAADSSGAPIERAVLELGLAGEESIFGALARYLGLAYVGQDEIDLGLDERLGLEASFLERVGAIPVQVVDDKVIVATAIADCDSILESIGFYLSMQVVPAITAPSTIRNALEQRSDGVSITSQAAQGDVERLLAIANDGPIVKYVNDIVAKAVVSRASDIHLEAQETGARIRIRIDGILRVEGTVPADRLAAVVSRIKVIANLNISEKRRPQDGRISMPVRGRRIDIRVSTLPTQYGESIVMRLLDQDRVALDWKALGFGADRISALRRIIGQPNGIFLVAGPTGSGKTTTLYTALKEINQDHRKIVTVEDPIEYSLPGVNQTQVDGAIDMTFARALRAILRQDPDVVMVGEIRDQETAEIAVRAALIGRLVLSTIHTNDSISAITRLIDLGVPSFLLASTLRGVLSQRLVKRLCERCKGQGCFSCDNNGGIGRQVISELLTITSRIAENISNGASQKLVLDEARQEGCFVAMREDAERLLQAGKLERSAMEYALGPDLG